MTTARPSKRPLGPASRRFTLFRAAWSISALKMSYYVDHNHHVLIQAICAPISPPPPISPPLIPPPTPLNVLYCSLSGVGSSAPELRLTNKDLESIVETNDEWITQRTGIQSRHIMDTKYVLAHRVRGPDGSHF